jgi:hypothetical protein
MAKILKTNGFLAEGTCFAILLVFGCTTADAQSPESGSITITLAGQSMIRSDIRTTAPASVPVIQGLLKGDVVFTNLEAAVAEKGETIHEGR